jgi:hypothetical protein
MLVHSLNTPNKRHSKVNELQLVHGLLYRKPLTATQAAVMLNIYRPNLSWLKRELEKNGHLVEIKKVVCPVTGCWASLLTTNPDMFPNNPQLNLFQ